MSKLILIYYTDENGKSPVLNFINSLNIAQQGKVRRAIKPILEFGIGTHLLNTKKLSGYPLWEIRILGRDNIRILYATEIKGRVTVLHGFIKKTQKTPMKEIKVAIRRLAETKRRLT